MSLELGHDEVGSTDDPDLIESREATDRFAELGLPDPGPLRVLPVEHQIAQKLHACTSRGDNDRARDLVDLQLVADRADLMATAHVANRLFRARGEQTWPPTIRAGDTWPGLYDEAARALDVLPTVEEAVSWANDLVARIDGAV